MTSFCVIDTDRERQVAARNVSFRSTMDPMTVSARREFVGPGGNFSQHVEHSPWQTGRGEHTEGKARMRARKILLAGAAAAVAVFGPVAAVHADDYVGTTPPTVLGNQLQRHDPNVLGETVTRSSGLPVTGGDIAEMTAIGVGAIGLGTVLVRRSRRKTGRPAPTSA